MLVCKLPAHGPWRVIAGMSHAGIGQVDGTAEGRFVEGNSRLMIYWDRVFIGSTFAGFLPLV